jgi:DNA-binding transcriptional LysR family regulator
MPKSAKPRNAGTAIRTATPAAAHKYAIRPPRIFSYVDAVAHHGSIRRAAEALHVASSALNRRILDLEEELGTTLFERLPRGVRLTAAGELFVDYVRRNLSALELVGSQIEHLRGLVRGQVRVAAAESLAGDLLPRAIGEFQSSHPGVRFQVRISVPGDMLAALMGDTVDLMLTHETPAHPDASVLASVAHPFCAVMARDHPLAKRRALRLRDCFAYPVALADQSLAGRALIERALAKSSFHFEPALVSNSVEAMKAYARTSKAVCFQFKTGAAHDVARGEMVAVPLADPALSGTQLVLAARRGRVLPIAAAKFSEQLCQNLNSL